MSLEGNKAIVRRLFQEAWNRGNLNVVDELLTTNYVFHEPISGDIRGPGGYKQFVTVYRTGAPDIHFTIEDQVAEGDKVVTRYTTTGTHQGNFMGIAPTGKRLRVTGIAIVRFEGGKIAEDWVNWDALGLMQQLGVVPPLG
jgi:steroid delta-isomerase-like uncharacterized protein